MLHIQMRRKDMKLVARMRTSLENWLNRKDFREVTEMAKDKTGTEGLTVWQEVTARKVVG